MMKAQLDLTEDLAFLETANIGGEFMSEDRQNSGPPHRPSEPGPEADGTQAPLLTPEERSREPRPYRAAP